MRLRCLQLLGLGLGLGVRLLWLYFKPKHHRCLQCCDNMVGWPVAERMVSTQLEEGGWMTLSCEQPDEVLVYKGAL
jgi:hypothetical protein